MSWIRKYLKMSAIMSVFRGDLTNAYITNVATDIQFPETQKTVAQPQIQNAEPQVVNYSWPFFIMLGAFYVPISLLAILIISMAVITGLGFALVLLALIITPVLIAAGFWFMVRGLAIILDKKGVSFYYTVAFTTISISLLLFSYLLQIVRTNLAYVLLLSGAIILPFSIWATEKGWKPSLVRNTLNFLSVLGLVGIVLCWKFMGLSLRL